MQRKMRTGKKLRLRRALIICSTLLVGKASLGLVDDQVSPDERNARYAEIVEACEYNRTCIDSKALELLSFDELPSCESKELLTALLLLNRDLDSPYFLEAKMTLEGCDTLFSSLRYNLGLAALRAEEFQRAEYHFYSGAMLPNNERKSAFLSAAGASAYHQGDLETAASHFQSSYYIDSLSASPMLLSNLSAIALDMKELEDAYNWGVMAIRRYKALVAEEQMSLDDGGFLMLVNGNLFIACVALQDKTASDFYFSECEFFENGFFASEQKMQVFNDFLRLQGSADYLAIYEGRIDEILKAVNDSILTSQENQDPMLFLFSPKASEYLVPSQRNKAWAFLAQLFPLPNDRNEETSAELLLVTTSDSSPWMWPGLIAVLLAINAILLRGLRKRMRTNSRLRGRRLVLFESMRLGKWNDELRDELVAILSVPAAPSAAPLQYTKELTKSQKIVLSEGIRGRYPKDTAQAHGWSPQYVYQMRSEIRNALDIDANTSLELWAVEHEKFLKELLGAHFNPLGTPDEHKVEDKNQGT